MLRKIKIILLLALGLFLLFAAVSCYVPPLFHKRCEEEDAAESLRQPSSATERVLCVDDNVEALLWRIRIIESARNEIILSTFDFREDESGLAVMACLLEAAKKDVQVKIIVNGIAGFLQLDNSDCFKALAAHPNVEVKYYNPVNLLTPWKLNYSLHDKYLTADDKVYVLGGRNTFNLFLGDYQEEKNIDRDILVYEEEYSEQFSIAAVKSYFYDIWEMDCSKTQTYRLSDKKKKEAEEKLSERYEALKEEYPQAFLEVDWEEETLAANSVKLITNPMNCGNKEPVLWTALCALMKEADQAVIQTPYIVCSGDMYDDLYEVTS